MTRATLLMMVLFILKSSLMSRSRVLCCTCLLVLTRDRAMGSISGWIRRVPTRTRYVPQLELEETINATGTTAADRLKAVADLAKLRGRGRVYEADQSALTRQLDMVVAEYDEEEEHRQFCARLGSAFGLADQWMSVNTPPDPRSLEQRLADLFERPVWREYYAAELDAVKKFQDRDDGTHTLRVALDVSADLHCECVSAVCRRRPVDLRVGMFTEDADTRGMHDVTCTRDESVFSLASRSQGIGTEPLAGAKMHLRVPSVRLKVFPWQQPLTTQPAILTLPGGAQARGTILHR
eukprot:COSAG01_NODE_45_length_32100_cov_28.037218_22_plen_294_part_00